jgi:hypothetical protein
MPAIAAAPIAMAILGGVASGAVGAALKAPAKDLYEGLKGKLQGDDGGEKANAAVGQMPPRGGAPGAEGAEAKGGLMGKMQEMGQQLKSALDTGQPIKSAVSQGEQQLQAMLQGIKA